MIAKQKRRLQLFKTAANHGKRLKRKKLIIGGTSVKTANDTNSLVVRLFYIYLTNKYAINYI